MFTVDGVTWAAPCTCDVERKAEIRSSEISGELMDSSYFNDVEGTYYSYQVSMAVPLSMQTEYDQLYEILTEPVDGHSFILPYNQTTITITGRVEEVQDKCYRASTGQYWQSVKFEVLPNNASKMMSLSEVIARGMSPLPEVQSVAEGTIMQLTNGEWVELTLTDADEVEY